jgi:plasmid replication initiation protein
MNKLIVTKNLDLVNSNYSLTLEENRLINLSSGKIYFKTKMNEGSQCRTSVKVYSELYGVSYKEALKQIKEARISLLEKRVYITSSPSEPIKWIDDVIFETNDELFVLFTKDMIDHLFNLEKRFVMFDVALLKNIKNTNSIRLYELCKARNHVNFRFKLKIGIKDLKLKMQLESKYNKNSDLKRMLSNCIDEINEQTDIHVTLEEQKLGKKLVSFTFVLKQTEATAKAA